MKRILFVIVLVAAVLATTGMASAKTARITFTGSEWCDPDSFTFFRLVEAGPNAHFRGITQTCYDTASISQLTGTDYLFDARLSFVGAGPNFILSGKLRMESAEGGVWVGSWVLPANTDTIQVIAHGEGLYEGQELHWFLTEAGPFSGYILMPGE